MTALLSLSLVIVMFSAGLGLRGGDYVRLLRMPRAALTGLVLQMLFLPVWALLLRNLLAPDTEAAIGLMLTAMAPATVASHVLVGLAGGHIGLARSLSAGSTLLFAGWVWLTGPDPSWIFLLSGLVLLPFVAGIGVAAIARDFTGRAARVLSLAASLLTGLLVLQAIFRFGAALDMRIMLVVVALAGGAVVAAALGARSFAPGYSPSIGISTAMQNVAIPIVMAHFANGDAAAAVPALYGTVMYAVPFAIIILRARRR